MSSILIKNKGPKALSLNESQEAKGKKYVFEGVFTQCGVENRNNRIYDPEEILPHLAYLRDKIKNEGCILGELDHPEGRFEVYIKDASHKITDLWYEPETKCVMGKLELLNTTNGKTMQAVVDAGCPLFVSSRAAGTVGPDKHVSIQQIFTYDIVAVPGFAEAKLDRVDESMRARVMSFLNESKSAQAENNLAAQYGIDDELTIVTESSFTPVISEKKYNVDIDELSKPINEDIKVKVSPEKARELGLIGNKDNQQDTSGDVQDAPEEKKHSADEILGIVPKYAGQDPSFIQDIQPEFKSPEASTDSNGASVSAAQPQQNNTQNNPMQEAKKGKTAYINLMNETINNETFLNAKTLLKNVAKSSLFKSLNDVSLQKLKDESIYYQLVAHLPAPMKYDYEDEDEVDINVRDKFYWITINAEDINGKIKVEIEVERRMDDYFSDYGEKSFAISNVIAIEDAVNVVIKRLCSISTDTENFKPLIKKAIKGVFITESNKGKSAYINLMNESIKKEKNQENQQVKKKYDEEIDLNEEGDDVPNPIADGKKGSDTDKVVASSHKKEEKEEKGGNDEKVDQNATSKNDKAEEQSEIKESKKVSNNKKNIHIINEAFGNDHYPIKLGLNKNVPFISYNENNDEGMNFYDVNVVATNDPKERATCIVVEKDGKYADFYYNGREECFKQLSDPGYEEDSWENQEFGKTPDIIKKNGVSYKLINELIEGEVNESIKIKQDKNLQRLKNKKKELQESTDKLLGFYDHIIEGVDTKANIRESIIRQWPFSISLSESNFEKFAILSPEDKNKCADFIWKNKIFDIQRINETFMRPLSEKINETKNFLRLASASDVQLYMNAPEHIKKNIEEQAACFILESKEDVDEFWRRTGLRETLNKQVQNESFVEDFNKKMTEGVDQRDQNGFLRAYGYDQSFIEQVGRMM